MPRKLRAKKQPVEKVSNKEVADYAITTHLRYSAGQLDNHLFEYKKDYAGASPSEALERAQGIVLIFMHHTLPFAETPRNMHGSYRTFIQHTRAVRETIDYLKPYNAVDVNQPAVLWSFKLVVLWLEQANLLLFGKSMLTSSLRRHVAAAKLAQPAQFVQASVVTTTVPEHNEVDPVNPAQLS